MSTQQISTIKIREDKYRLKIEALEKLVNGLNEENEMALKACERFRTAVSKLEEKCNTQQEQIQTFEKQLAVATEKLKLADVTATEAMTGYEEQKEKIKYLEERLTQAESQIAEGEEMCSTQQEQIWTFEMQLAVATEKLKLADVTATEAMTGYEEQKEKIKYLEERLTQAESQIAEGEEMCNAQQEQIRTFEKQLAVMTEKLKLADVTAIEAMTGYEEQKEKIKYLEERLAEAESRIVEGDELRKKLHNTMLELKGNIRVFVRVRPLLQFDGDSNGPEGASISFPTSVESTGRGIDLINQGQKLSFFYDKVFDHDASQEDVFVEISQLVQSALDGYKVCIFAYGQTGSGKTYTMMGKPGIDQQGVIPRSLDQIFKTRQFLESQGWNYSMQASMLEIYNETIHDLLAPGRSNGFDMTSSKQCTIKHNLHDLTNIDVFDIADVTTLLEKATQSRSVGKTQMNEQSSRSHFVFKLKISRSNKNTGQHIQGVLNLIDLAGSERLAKSGSTGDRLKETQNINRSLSTLGLVISAIANRDAYVPFRNSTLTHLLQPYLGGDSKTLMFVNISPEASSVGETICSLRFASTVNGCVIGIPRRQTQASGEDDDPAAPKPMATPKPVVTPFSPLPNPTPHHPRHGHDCHRPTLAKPPPPLSRSLRFLG